MEQSDLKDRNDDFPVTPMTESHPYALPDLYAAKEENPFKEGVNEAGEEAQAVSASNFSNPELEDFSLASGPSGYNPMDDNFMGTPFSSAPSLDGMMPNQMMGGYAPGVYPPGVYPPGCFNPGTMMATPYTTPYATQTPCTTQTPFTTQMPTSYTAQYPGLYPGLNQQSVYPAGSFPYSMPSYMPSNMYGSYMEPPYMMMMQMMQAVMQQMAYLIAQLYQNIPGCPQPYPTQPPGEPEKYPHLPAAATPQWLNTLISG